MTLTDLSMLAFTVLNIGRVAAYAPQIVRIWRDRQGASAVSITTWTAFAAAHLATVAYVACGSGDALVLVVFLLNALCCLIIVAVTAWKRRRHQNATTRAGRAPRPRWALVRRVSAERLIEPSDARP